MSDWRVKRRNVDPVIASLRAQFAVQTRIGAPPDVLNDLRDQLIIANLIHAFVKATHALPSERRKAIAAAVTDALQES